jgi:hypothetical protein
MHGEGMEPQEIASQESLEVREGLIMRKLPDAEDRTLPIIEVPELTAVLDKGVPIHVISRTCHGVLRDRNPWKIRIVL